MASSETNSGDPAAAASSLSSSSSPPPPPSPYDVKETIGNMIQVQESLESLMEHSRLSGLYGSITREWGFATPGGLGPRLGGKFVPWEEKLSTCADFFPPIEAYDYFLDHPNEIQMPQSLLQNKLIQKEGLLGHASLHLFLMRPPVPAVSITAADLKEYKTACRIFILLAHLAHLCGNAAVEPTPLPDWIEEPLLKAAQRLDVEPVLSMNFIALENWIWREKPLTATGTAAVAAGKRRGSHKQPKDLNPETLIELLRSQLEIKDRWHRVTLYKNCFLAKDAVDIIVREGFAATRADAVRVGRKLNFDHAVWEHVSDQHLLVDDHLFFRFTRNYASPSSLSSSLLVRNKAQKQLDKEIISTLGLVRIKDRRYLMRVYHKCFVAQDAVDVLVNAGLAQTRGEAVQVAKRVNREYKLFEHVTGSHDFEDSYLFFRFFLTDQGDDDDDTTENASGSGSGADGSLAAAKQKKEREAALENDVIAALGQVVVKDRRYGLRMYPQCFVGSEAVQRVLAAGICKSRPEAVRILHRVNTRRNLFKHCKGHHDIKDEYLFYCFLPDSGVTGSQELTPDKDQTESGTDTITSRSAASDEEELEFRVENFELLYAGFGNHSQEINFQGHTGTMAYQLKAIPFVIVDVLFAMQSILQARQVKHESQEQEYTEVLARLLHQMAFCLSRAKEQFQMINSDPGSHSHVSKYVFIRQLQPLQKGILVRRTPGGPPEPAPGRAGVQFPYFHLVDHIIGRYHFGEAGDLQKATKVNRTFPRIQREYIERLAYLDKNSTIRGFLDMVGRPEKLVVAFNHLIECYGGDGGILQAHSRKLYSFMHNNLQVTTGLTKAPRAKGAPVTSKENHGVAIGAYKAVYGAAKERERLRIAPLMTRVKKVVYSNSDSGGFATVGLVPANEGDDDDDGDSSGMSVLQYSYGDVVRVVLPNDRRTTLAWIKALQGTGMSAFRLKDLPPSGEKGWTWEDLWQALGWDEQVSLETLAEFIEYACVTTEATGGKKRWINSPLDLLPENERFFAMPPSLSPMDCKALVPVSPRVYSVSGVEPDRAYFLVSKPSDKKFHHGYERMADQQVEHVYCSFSPSTHFVVPPEGVNLVCVASGTGISPFVGLASEISARAGTYTIVHQCKSNDMFHTGTKQWLDFTLNNPGAVVFGFISGDGSKRCRPMVYVIENGEFEETFMLSDQSSRAYYHQSPQLLARLEEVYKRDGLNLAYCCGGVRSAIQPVKDIVKNKNWKYYFTVESYAVSSPPGDKKDTCILGGSRIGLEPVGPVHPGGDHILRQVQSLAIQELEEEETNENEDEDNGPKVPDHSSIFWSTHPDAYNLYRTLRAPKNDVDAEAYEKFETRRRSVQRSLKERRKGSFLKEGVLESLMGEI